MKLTVFLPPLAALLPLAFAEDLQWCGKAQFYPSKYSCSSSMLCPKTASGKEYIACGTACYDAGTYDCNVKQLQLRTPDSEVQCCGNAPYKPDAVSFPP